MQQYPKQVWRPLIQTHKPNLNEIQPKAREIMRKNHLTYKKTSMTQFSAKSRSCVNICWSGLKTLSTNLHTKLEWNSISSSRDHVQEPTVWQIVLNRLCKWAYGGHIGLNQEIVLRASTTGVVLLLYKVSLISVWRQLRNSWSHTLVSDCWRTTDGHFMIATAHRFAKNSIFIGYAWKLKYVYICF